MPTFSSSSFSSPTLPTLIDDTSCRNYMRWLKSSWLAASKASAPEPSPTDTSAPASPAQMEELPQTIGPLLYYARALDCIMLPAVTTLSSLQSAPTLNGIAKLNRLLGYCSAFPDHQLIFRPSRMLLQTHSDVSR